MIYRGYIAKIDVDEEGDFFYGELDITDVVTFQGKTAKEFMKAFKESVDNYIKFKVGLVNGS